MPSKGKSNGKIADQAPGNQSETKVKLVGPHPASTTKKAAPTSILHTRNEPISLASSFSSYTWRKMSVIIVKKFWCGGLINESGILSSIS
jgi:hypothetical protein